MESPTLVRKYRWQTCADNSTSSGSIYFKYNGTFGIVLLGVANANYDFI